MLRDLVLPLGFGTYGFVVIWFYFYMVVYYFLDVFIFISAFLAILDIFLEVLRHPSSTMVGIGVDIFGGSVPIWLQMQYLPILVFAVQPIEDILFLSLRVLTDKKTQYLPIVVFAVQPIEDIFFVPKGAYGQKN